MGRGLLVAAVGAGLLLVAGCDWVEGANTARDEFTVGERITSVRLTSDAGAVRIRTGDRTAVHRELHFDRQRPGPTHRVEGDVLVIDSCPVRDCAIDYDVTVPEGTRVDGTASSGRVELDGVASVNLKVDSGSTTVRGVSGQVNLEASSGRVHLADIGGAVAVRADSGSVSVENARGSVTAEVQSGNLDVSLAEARDVRATADSGRITVTVPKGAYQVLASTDSGRVDSGVTSDPAAGNRLELDSDSGNITVRYAA
jgi:hypothetical protein